MSDLPIWTQDKAREWWHEWGQKYPQYGADDSPADEQRMEENTAKYNAEAEASLAALLREVWEESKNTEHSVCVMFDGMIADKEAERARVLAEVRRVVSENDLISEEVRRSLLREIEHV